MTLYSRQGYPLPKTNTANNKPIHVRDRLCVRCGGAGKSEAWRYTGSTCYRCGGNGKDPIRETVKLYTAEQLEKLNARKAKADANRAAAKAERDRLEQERRDAEKAEMISDYQGFLDRIGDELAYGNNEILQSVVERITVQVKDPTDRQIEIVNKIIADRSAERVRLAGARHVGTIKERRDFTLTLVTYRYSRSELRGVGPVDNHWSLFTDENGCKVACKSAPWLLGMKKTYREGRDPHDFYYERGQTIKVKATVTQHRTDNRGEPVTYINRPKVI